MFLGMFWVDTCQHPKENDEIFVNQKYVCFNIELYIDMKNPQKEYLRVFVLNKLYYSTLTESETISSFTTSFFGNDDKKIEPEKSELFNISLIAS